MALYLSIPRKPASSLPSGAAGCGAVLSEGENLTSQLRLDVEAPPQLAPHPPADTPKAESGLQSRVDDDITVRVSADDLRRLVARAFAAA
jgi:hypothetical protein